MKDDTPITTKQFDTGVAVAWDFLRRVHHETTIFGVVRCIQNAFQGILPKSCVALWLWDEEKHKACRVLYQKQIAHAPLPQFLESSHPILAAALSQPEEREAVVHHADERDLGILQCPKAPHLIWLSVRTTNDLRLLLTICLKTPGAIDDSIKRFINFMTLLSLQELQRARLQEERDLLTKIANLAHQSSTRSDFLTAVASEVRTVFAARGCTLLLYDSIRNTLYSKWTTGLQDPRTLKPLTEVEYSLDEENPEGITGWIGQRRQTLRLFNARDPGELASIDPTGTLKMSTKSRETHVGREDSPRPFLGAPILLGDQQEPLKLLGVIRLSQKQEQRGAAFLPYDEKLVEAVTEVLAPAIEHWNQAEEREERLYWKESFLQFLEAMHADDQSDPDHILDIIAYNAQQLFSAYGCTVFLALPGQNLLQAKAHSGEEREKYLDLNLTFEQGLCGMATKRRQPIPVADVSKLPEYHVASERVRSELAIPFFFGDELLGVLCLSSTEIGHFTEPLGNRAEHIEALAKQTAIAIHRGLVLREREEWRKNLVRMTKVATTGSVATGLAHEIKNGLAAISGHLRSVERDPCIKTLPQNIEALERVKSRGQDLVALANRLLDLSRSDVPHKREVYLNELVTDVMLMMEPLVKDNSQVLDWKSNLDPTLDRPKQGTGVRFKLDDRQIVQVLVNLVLNAVDASSRGQRIDVHTRNSTDEFAAVEVEDYGVGIKPEDRGKLFQMFFTTKAHGLGVGLQVSRLLVQGNGGSIEFTSKPGAGTKFIVQLPKS